MSELSPAEIVRVQRRLGVPRTSVWDEESEAALRAWQASRGLIVSGRLDDVSTAILASLSTIGLTPVWFGTERQDVTVIERIGGTDEDSIRRFQSAAGLPLTGVIDEDTAQAIGD